MAKRVKIAKQPLMADKVLQPAQQVENYPLDKIIPYPNNPRTHSDEQVKLLAQLMQRYGVDQPIVVDEKGIIIKGHGRRLAAIEAGFTTFPVVVQRGLDDAAKRAIRIADNQVTLLSGWDQELIKLEVSGLKLEGFDLPLLGFSENALEMLFAPDIDAAAEWIGMPEFEQNAKKAYKTMMIHFKDAEAVEKFASLVEQKITADTRFIWYPMIEIEHYVDKQYATESADTE